MKLAYLVLALALAAPLSAQDSDARARSRVALALSDTLDTAATAELANAFDDKDETVRLAAAVAACHSTVLSQSLFTFALGTVHTSIRPALRKRPSEQDWSLTPAAVAKVVQTYLPPDLPPAKLARLKAAATDTNNLTRDVAQFLLSRDAFVSAPLAKEVDALLFDPQVKLMYRIELAAMCIDRLGLAVLPVIDSVKAQDGEAAAAVHALLGLIMDLPGGPSAIGRVAAQATGDAALIAAATLIENVRGLSDARIALKEAFRAETIQPAVREYIARETERLRGK